MEGYIPFQLFEFKQSTHPHTFMENQRNKKLGLIKLITARIQIAQRSNK